MSSEKSIDSSEVVHYLDLCRGMPLPGGREKPVLDLRSVFGCHRRMWQETERRMVALGCSWPQIEDMKQYALSAPSIRAMIERLRSRFYVQERY